MKHFVLAAIAMLFSVSLSAATLETKTSYASVQDTDNQGMVYGLNYSFNVYEGTSFIENVTVGGLVDFGMFEGKAYNLFFAPIVKVELPLTYVKVGYGYDYVKVAGSNSNDWAMFVGAGVKTKLTDAVNFAFDYTMKYNIIAKTYTHMFGPAISFNL